MVIISFTIEELNIILDGLEDTKELIKQNKAKPTSIRYVAMLKVIRNKIKQKFKESK